MNLFRAVTIMIVKPKKERMDIHAIKAELARRGVTARQMAKESGFSTASLYEALRRPSTKVNTYIASKLGIPLNELWPDWFDADGDLIPARYRRKLKQMRDQPASQIRNSSNRVGVAA